MILKFRDHEKSDNKMYKCDKCICIKCKNYFDNGGNCEYCSMCTVVISNEELFKHCDDFEEDNE